LPEQNTWDTILGKTTTSRTIEQRKPKSRVRLNSRRKTIIEMNKKRPTLHMAGFRTSRLRLKEVNVTSTGITQTHPSKNNDESYKVEISTSSKVPEEKESKIDLAFNAGRIKLMTSVNASTSMPETGVTIHSTINSDGSSLETSRTDLDYPAQTTVPTSSEDFTSPPVDNSPPRKRMTKPSNTFQLMSTEEAQSAISSHHARSLVHQPGYSIPSIQNVKEKIPHASKFVKPNKELLIFTSKEDAKISTPFVVEGSEYVAEGSEDLMEGSEDVVEGYEDVVEGSEDAVDAFEEKLMHIFDGQYHEIEPGQYHEIDPGQYHEENPGQYHEHNPGRYHETYPGQYHEINPGQEVQLNIKFNPLEETKTYNVHKKTGDYIIGEVGKINVNNGQTFEGVRYTAVDGIVNQAQITEILQRFFGTKTN